MISKIVIGLLAVNLGLVSVNGTFEEIAEEQNSQIYQQKTEYKEKKPFGNNPLTELKKNNPEIKVAIVSGKEEPARTVITTKPAVEATPEPQPEPVEPEENEASLPEAQKPTPPPSDPEPGNPGGTYPVYGDWEDLIKQKCSKYGCNWLFVSKIMGCESGRRSNAYNSAGPYIGLFQFDNSTFYANVRYLERYTGTRIKNPDIWSPYHQIEVASWMLAWDKEGSKWPSCSAKAKEEMNYDYK